MDDDDASLAPRNFPDGPPWSDARFRAAMEKAIHRDIKGIARQSSLVVLDAEYWDVTRISWTGEEWPGLPAHPGICYVEAFEHANPPHDFIYAVSVRSGAPEFLACYEGDMDFFALTVSRLEADGLGLPERVVR